MSVFWASLLYLLPGRRNVLDMLIPEGVATMKKLGCTEGHRLKEGVMHELLFSVAFVVPAPNSLAAAEVIYAWAGFSAQRLVRNLHKQQWRGRGDRPRYLVCKSLQSIGERMQIDEY